MFLLLSNLLLAADESAIATYHTSSPMLAAPSANPDPLDVALCESFRQAAKLRLGNQDHLYGALRALSGLGDDIDCVHKNQYLIEVYCSILRKPCNGHKSHLHALLKGGSEAVHDHLNFMLRLNEMTSGKFSGHLNFLREEVFGEENFEKLCQKHAKHAMLGRV